MTARFALVVGLVAGCETDPVAGPVREADGEEQARECAEPVEPGVRYADIGVALGDTCGACHYTEPAGLAVIEGSYTYDMLVGVPSTQAPHMPRVDPGHPDNSYLWHKLQGTHLDAGGDGDTMPPDSEEWVEYQELGSVPLSAEDEQRVRDWICGGALP